MRNIMIQHISDAIIIILFQVKACGKSQKAQ